MLISVFFVVSFVGISSAADKRTKPKVAAGAVKTIDLQAKTLTLREDTKPDLTCSFDDKTTLRSNNGQKITFADIKIGAILVLVYDIVDGKNIAKSITVAGQVDAPTPEKKG